MRRILYFEAVEKPFVIYRSSAGSGKTYTLALEYLKLALQQPLAYRSILAVTFTNKATQEMKGRIIQYLYEIAKAKDSPLRRALAESLNKAELELTLEAETVLQHLLHGYSYFSVMTIDAFFQKVVRGFAREMGLQAGFKIELDIDRVLDAVIDELLLVISEPEQRALRRWLTRFAEEKVEAGNSWDFRREIKELARELFKESYWEKQNTFADQAVTQQTTAELLNKLRELQSAFELHLHELGRTGLEVLQQEGLSVEDFSYGRSGVVGYFSKITEGSSYAPTARVIAGRDNIEAWVSKKNPRREQLLKVAAKLHPHLEQALDAYEEYGPLYHSVVHLQRFMYAYGILHHLRGQIDSYKRKNDLMLISDAPVFLQDIIGKDDTPFIYEKIGSYYQHFLIDEFQDTSGLQWINFRPLVENSLDAGYPNLVVGDVKQSIYRWRGGDWQLLLETIQADMQDWRTQVRNLDHNYRSLRNIISFNNALFETVPKLLYRHLTEAVEKIKNDTMRERLLTQTSVLLRAYEDVSQKLPDTYDHHAAWHGHVRIEMLDENYCQDEEGNQLDWRSYVQQQLPGLVESLQNEGYSANDIAFLVRDRRDGQAVVDTFMQYKNEGKAQPNCNYEVISSESLFLQSSLCVNLLIDLMRFLDNAQDSIVKGSIVYKYRKLTQQDLEPEDLHRIFTSQKQDSSEELLQELPDTFRKYYPFLNKLPIYELVENLVQIFDLGKYRENAYLQAFQDLVLQYSLSEQGDLHTFLDWWEEQGKSSSVQISDEVNALRVMTIHKAKGLQFKIVIIPFCDWSLDHYPFKTNVLWSNPSDSVLGGMGLLPMKYSSQLTDTLFSEEYYEEKIRVHLDHLNLLYVAFTRAEEGLYAFARPVATKKGDFQLKGVANLLRTVLPDLSLEDSDPLAGWDEMGQVYEVGAFPSRKSDESYQAEPLTLPEYSSVRWRNRLSVRPLSRGFFQADTSVGKVSQVALLQQVLIQLREVNELEAEIERVSFERGLTRWEQKQLREKLNQFLDRKDVIQWYQPVENLFIQRTLFSEKGIRFYTVDRVRFETDRVLAINFFTQYDQKEKKLSLDRAMVYLRRSYSKVSGFIVDVSQLSVKKVD